MRSGALLQAQKNFRPRCHASRCKTVFDCCGTRIHPCGGILLVTQKEENAAPGPPG